LRLKATSSPSSRVRLVRTQFGQRARHVSAPTAAHPEPIPGRDDREEAALGRSEQAVYVGTRSHGKMCSSYASERMEQPAREPLRCENCDREPREDENAAYEWRVYPDGLGELLIFCPECAQREFGARRETTEV
jgi:hypothetical protein